MAMSINKEQEQVCLRKKAIAIANAIQTYNGKDKENVPTKAFCDDYNRLRNQVLENWPELSNVIPPEVKISSISSGEYSQPRYIEIMTYAQQIAELI